MKRTYMVEFELPEELDTEFLSLIPNQRQFIDELLAKGRIRSYSLAIDRSTLWMVVDALSEFEVMELISQMPLADHMEPFVSELMFHQTRERVLEFSLN